MSCRTQGKIVSITCCRYTWQNWSIQAKTGLVLELSTLPLTNELSSGKHMLSSNTQSSHFSMPITNESDILWNEERQKMNWILLLGPGLFFVAEKRLNKQEPRLFLYKAAAGPRRFSSAGRCSFICMMQMCLMHSNAAGGTCNGLFWTNENDKHLFWCCLNMFFCPRRMRHHTHVFIWRLGLKVHQYERNDTEA